MLKCLAKAPDVRMNGVLCWIEAVWWYGEGQLSVAIGVNSLLSDYLNWLLADS